MNQYLDRITSQHRTKPKLMRWLATLLSRVQDTNDFIASIDSAFDLDHAVGAQLDMLGQVSGVQRLLNFEPVYSSPLLSDDYYRMLQKAKISLNQWDGTIEGIQNIWGGELAQYRLEVVDHQDMSMTIRVMELDNLFESEFISRGYLAPKPQTVRVNYLFVLTRRPDAQQLQIGGGLPCDYTTFTLQNDALEYIALNEERLHIGGQIAIADTFTLDAEGSF